MSKQVIVNQDLRYDIPDGLLKSIVLEWAKREGIVSTPHVEIRMPSGTYVVITERFELKVDENNKVTMGE